MCPKCQKSLKKRGCFLGLRMLKHFPMQINGNCLFALCHFGWWRFHTKALLLGSGGNLYFQLANTYFLTGVEVAPGTPHWNLHRGTPVTRTHTSALWQPLQEWEYHGCRLDVRLNPTLWTLAILPKARLVRIPWHPQKVPLCERKYIFKGPCNIQTT